MNKDEIISIINNMGENDSMILSIREPEKGGEVRGSIAVCGSAKDVVEHIGEITKSVLKDADATAVQAVDFALRLGKHIEFCCAEFAAQRIAKELPSLVSEDSK